MFDETQSKLADVRTAIEATESAKDGQSYRGHFTSTLSALRTVINTLQAEGKRHYRKHRNSAETIRFTKWCKEEFERMQNDELMSFIIESRNREQHEGRHPLIFGSQLDPTMQDSFSANAKPSGVLTISPMTINMSELPKSPYPGAELVIRPDGTYWLVDKDLPSERRIPLVETNDNVPVVTTVAVADPPKSHLDKDLETDDPIEISRLALNYLEGLVHRAKAEFKAID